MKTLILLFFSLLFCFSVYGQEENVDKDTVVLVRKNVLKFLPENLVFNSTSFEYERKVNGKNSIVFGFGIPTPTTFAGKFDMNDSENRITNESFSTLAFRFAYRHYTGHRIQPAGFYISPYAKYQNLVASAVNYKTPDTGSSYVENYDFKANTVNLGLQFGVQFLIAKRLSIDFYFLGIEAGLANIDVSINSPDTGKLDIIVSDVNDQIKDLPAPFDKKVTATKNGFDQISVKGQSIPYPWFRSGVSIGIAF
jgi:hypothetical protein